MSMKFCIKSIKKLGFKDLSGSRRRIGDICSVDVGWTNTRLEIYNIPFGCRDSIKSAILSEWPNASIGDAHRHSDGSNALSVTYCGDNEGHYSSISSNPKKDKEPEVKLSSITPKARTTGASDAGHDARVGDLRTQIGQEARTDGNQKVAIVGVEGSGKTVMLAGLGALYLQPNSDGVFISPKNFKTLTYVDRLMSMLKSGEWPAATAGDVMQGLDWVVRQKIGDARPVQLGQISLLDFAGEVYRAAFVQEEGENKTVENEIARLKKYLAEADCILVLVNLSDVITNGPFNARVEESVWITNAILDYVLSESRADGKSLPRAAIVLSQADSYASTIEECGGPKQTLQRYLPHVANNYGWLDTFAVSSVDKTVLDENGHSVPAKDFSSNGLAPIMEWVLRK